VNLLLDTHVLLWWLDDHPTLSKEAREAIADAKNLVFISAAVIWEIRIKQGIGKLKIPKNFRSVLEDQPFEMMDITADHAHAVGQMPMYHRDPFDRMLVAQAKVDGLTIVSRDVHLKKYKVPIIEA
jgi:PIN domain nuclease of toxin-antitoxin system